MKQLLMHGVDDDTILVRGMSDEVDEYELPAGDRASFLLFNPFDDSRQLRIWAQYENAATWSFGVSPAKDPGEGNQAWHGWVIAMYAGEGGADEDDVPNTSAVLQINYLDNDCELRFEGNDEVR